MMKVKLYLNYAGYCFAKSSHVVNGDKRENIKFHALFAIINHPKLGWILFDTGYTKRFYEETKKYPNKIYADITKVVIEDHQELKNQLQSFGIKTNDIKHIIISHFHADHIGGLQDFPNAKIYCSKKAYSQVKMVSNFFAFSKGILKGLIPDDIQQRIIYIEDCSKIYSDEIFGLKYDIFQDDSIISYNLPGHAAGQIGIEIETNKKKYLLAADSCWDYRAFKEYKLPSEIVRLFFNSWTEYKDSLLKLKKYHEVNPQIVIVPTHCSKTTEKLVSNKINMDVL